MVQRNTIKYLLKVGGPEKIIRALMFFLYDKIKRNTIDLRQNQKIILNNFKIETLPNDKGISSELLIYGIHEPLSTHLILREVKEGMICLDLGSNIGYYAIIESNLVGKTGKVIAVEPVPINFSLLKSNLNSQNNQNFEVHNFAIGEENGELEFIVSAKSNWSKIRSKDCKVDPNDKIIKVPVKTLDSFFNEKKIERIDFVRMDIEGYEMKILLGSKKILRDFKPKLMIEFHKMYLGDEKTRRFLDELSNLGYEIKYFIPRIYDSPIIGKISDIKNLKIKDVLNQLNKNILPDVFQLILTHQNDKIQNK